MDRLRQDSDVIISRAIEAALPDTAVAKALERIPHCDGKIILVAVGKAAWQMAKAAYAIAGDSIDSGIVITKYGHAKGPIGKLSIFEAGHPVSDANTYSATEKAIAAVSGLKSEDCVLLLLSGGGSALFEKPLITPAESQNITKQLLACGANIVEINTIRKRISAVKGGRFAQLCKPAHVYTIVLSDIIGDPLDMIASGPAYPDSSSSEEALALVEKYGLKLSSEAGKLIKKETPKVLDNVTTFVTGSVKQLCESARESVVSLGYESVFLSASLDCEARDAGSFLAAIARDHQDSTKPLAFIAGGETVVHLTGHGKGGRNQEIALAAAQGIRGCKDTCIFSVGSDGTDGPTDAAGGYADGTTAEKLAESGVSIPAVLADNDAYHALEKCGGLIMTGATGTNVNDLTVLLIKR